MDVVVWLRSLGLGKYEAAWVQAIGAIIALAVVIFVPAWMARNHEYLRRRRLEHKVDVPTAGH
jgi:hypothetical protein